MGHSEPSASSTRTAAEQLQISELGTPQHGDDIEPFIAYATRSTDSQTWPNVTRAHPTHSHRLAR